MTRGPKGLAIIISGDLAELVDRGTAVRRQGTNRVCKAMVEVVVDQPFLGLGNRLLNGMELLGNVEAGLLTLGAPAAIGSRQVTKRFPWFLVGAGRAPYLSGALIILAGRSGTACPLDPSIDRRG